jgi:tetratricopeptide (TPR) repeat protein
MAQAVAAYEKVWRDYLSNKCNLAERQAIAHLQSLAALDAAERTADTHVTEADFAYIAGATRGNDVQLLERALEAYGRHLNLIPFNTNARRMMAETYMRLRRYEEAFDVFDELLNMLSDFKEDEIGELEIAPFRLRHDADQLELLLGCGDIKIGMADSMTDAIRFFRELADDLDRGAMRVDTDSVSQRIRRTRVKSLPAEAQARLYLHGYNRLPPLKGLGVGARSLHALCDRAFWVEKDPLAHHPKAVWADIAEKYMSERLVVVDEFLSADALEELRRFVARAPIFRTMRAGFLGSFPADGATHVVIRKLAESLRERLPSLLDKQPLGLWWFFKYTDEAPNGIGIHADPAAVNINIWLTPDEARVRGGGLTVFKRVADDRSAVADYNHEFASEEAEMALRQQLEEGGSVHVEYRSNRAVIFISDQFHVSEPFEFKRGYENHRVNLTLLFGDRLATSQAGVAQAPHAAARDTSADDLFG